MILKERSDKIAKEDRLYAGIVFDHGYISEKTHQWVIRRWNAFFIASSSTVALLTSLFIGHLLGIRFTSYWLWTDIIAIVLFTLQAYSSWIETMRMIQFLIRVKKDTKNEMVVE